MAIILNKYNQFEVDNKESNCEELIVEDLENPLLDKNLKDATKMVNKIILPLNKDEVFEINQPIAIKSDEGKFSAWEDDTIFSRKLRKIMTNKKEGRDEC